jgi:hypothetical protein
MGGDDLQPYYAELRAAGARLYDLLADGSTSVTEIALARGVYDLMDTQLLRWPYAVLQNFDGQAEPQTGVRNEKYWRYVMEWSVRRDLLPLEDENNAETYRQLYADYYRLALDKLLSTYAPPRRAEDRVIGIVYLYRPNQAVMRKVMPIVADELMRWFRRHQLTKEFLAQPAKTGFFEFLLCRPDIAALLRLIDHLPLDVTPYSDPSIITGKTQTAAQALVETAISFVPVVGDVVAAYESTSGQDLFGNPLNPLDRGILGASVLLPMVGMLVKDGRTAYSETRLVRLYGRTEEEWSHAIDAVGRLKASDLKVLGEAEEALRLQKSLEPALARRAAAALPDIAKPTGLLESAVDKAVSEAFVTLRRSHPIMATLDEYALVRILEKGPNPDLIKGQLFEELIETRVVPWLADPNGYVALGFVSPVRPGSTVIFIPGHMISDVSGRQLTDGILASWENNELNILVVFEAKAGKSAARELRISKGGLSSLTEAERADLRAEARRVYRTLKRRAELQGTTFNQTFEDVEKELLDDIQFSEAGGQVRRDVERLYENADGTPSLIYIGDRPRPVPVRISPTTTKFFGILPSNVDPTSIVDELSRLGYKFEAIGLNIRSRDLRAIADRLTSLASQVIAALP